MSADAEKDYQIGYGKPPKTTQFKKGQSGNPKGRTKGSKNFRTALTDELSQIVQFTEDGQRKSATKRQVMLRNLTNKAAKGDPRSIEQVLKQLQQMLPETREPKEEKLSPDQQNLLDDFVRRKVKKLDGGAADE
ncbi:DUF5681 domain-containing protein [Henriciella algicola]|uniref:DUF5681 domain-containing protein n=1 Tax=Henriciella algicola TaxID=1608422 RepID=UPI0015F94F6D|nr:DUF5681 domain-containing protein [Henriciella algicola]